ncbi:general secretion pathway protein GspK [Neptunicella sp. SCSIO 80796]|uniref:general secretion pathway protein GspK n=1 Tax=Neptunicella plasticusilytica TaxID=3117012 RepID=UPI003A4D8478
MAYLKLKNQGAALIAVLIISIVLVVLMGVTSKLMDSRLQLAQQSRQMFRDQAAVYAKANELTYLLSTQRMTVAGISQGTAKANMERNDDGLFIHPVVGDELRVDGYQYRSDSAGVEYSIQNENGLIPVNTSTQYWIRRWLKGQGYNIVEQAKLADILADYADADDWRRPGGAEKNEYAAQKQSAPANFLLQSCTELQQLVGWQEVLKLHPEFMRYCSLRRSAGVNINAIPVSLWQAIWPQSAAQLAKLREKNGWFIRASEVNLVEPTFINEIEEMYSPLGGYTFDISVQKNAVALTKRISIGSNLIPPFVLRGNAVF